MSKVIDNIEDIASIDNHIGLSGITAYHLLQGNMSLSNTISTNGFSTTLYTGNGSTQSINTGVDMDTQWGNDVSEQFGGMVWLKNRDNTDYHRLFDTIRLATNAISSNLTTAQVLYTAGLTSFNNNGFSVGSGESINALKYASWNFQTTHRTSGTTNHGKAYTCHYNPFTGFTIVKYEGSGIAGHEIPHHLGRKLGFTTVKNLSAVSNHISQYRENYAVNINLTDAEVATSTNITSLNLDNIVIGTSASSNTSANQYIMYGWANSYIDENNKLIGNYEIGTYQGTGVAGNKVITRGKPAWLLTKRIDSTGNWLVFDNLRSGSNFLKTNLSDAEATQSGFISFNTDGFTFGYADGNYNTSGGQYLYMVVYDNDSASGKSKYPRATDTTQIQLNNAIIPLPNGIDTNGVKVSTVSKNETVTGVTLTQGKNFIRWEN